VVPLRRAGGFSTVAGETLVERKRMVR